MKIGNILYEKELVNNEKVEYINYYDLNETPSVTLENIDNSLPTLIVGWNLLVNKFPDLEVNILKHKIVDRKLYWEFSFNENKSSHVNGIKSFTENVPDFYFSVRYKYTNLDPIFHNIRDNQELFDILPKEINGYYKFKDRMLYILSNSKIYGLDLEMYNFFKFNVQGMLKKIDELNIGQKLIDSEGEYYQEYYKLFPEFSHLKRYLVAILSK